MNILMAIDFSSVTDAMIEALPICEGSSGGFSQIYVVHAAEPDPAFVGWEGGPYVVRSQMAEKFRGEHRDLAAIADRLRVGRTVKVTPLLMQGPTVETILEQAQKLEAGLIVVGSHGHGAAYDLTVGSISSGLIRRSPVPVLVVPSPER
ncbi:MAG TPA: universal stress protein [Longimicrobiales bacterium]|nr:universal stress protein [Longimicrobiales bacterium]